MAAKFEVYEGKNGKYYFRLKSGNGEVICTSQGYASETGAERGAESVQENAPKAKIEFIESED